MQVRADASKAEGTDRRTSQHFRRHLNHDMNGTPTTMRETHYHYKRTQSDTVEYTTPL